jgi:hypothetical protein
LVNWRFGPRIALAAVLPVSAFFHLGLYLENQVHLRHWQRELAGRVANHRSAAETEIRESENENRVPQTVVTALKLALPPPESGFCDNERLYAALYHTSATWRGSLSPQQADPVWNGGAGAGNRGIIEES